MLDGMTVHWDGKLQIRRGCPYDPDLDNPPIHRQPEANTRQKQLGI